LSQSKKLVQEAQVYKPRLKEGILGVIPEPVRQSVGIA
jgi:hypothetical protein